MSLWDFMFGGADLSEEYPVKKAEEYVSPFAKGAAAIASAKAARQSWIDASVKALEGFDDDQPAYKIIHQPAGHFQIFKKEMRAASWYETSSMGFYGMADYIYPADHWTKPTEPTVYYETIKDYTRPLYSHRGGSYGPDTYYDAVKFNVHDDAEAYLFRMVSPEDGTTEYDFPPLKKRVVKRPKPAAKN